MVRSPPVASVMKAWPTEARFRSPRKSNDWLISARDIEWEAAARGKDSLLFPWGEKIDATRADLNVEHMGAAAVDAYSAGASPTGCLQMIGTAWEWTTNQYLPYPGFTVDMYPYMSTLQFGYHKVTKGGSGATSSPLIRSTYRQAYLPDRHDVFTGFRTCAT